MILSAPFIITGRLLPGLRVADAYISIETHPRDDEGRNHYTYHIDIPGGASHSASDLASGCGGGDYAAGMESLLAFLEAAGEGYDHARRMRTPYDAADANFPEWVGEWAYTHANELTMARMELEGCEDCG